MPRPTRNAPESATPAPQQKPTKNRKPQPKQNPDVPLGWKIQQSGGNFRWVHANGVAGAEWESYADAVDWAWKVKSKYDNPSPHPPKNSWQDVMESPPPIRENYSKTPPISLPVVKCGATEMWRGTMHTCQLPHGHLGLHGDSERTWDALKDGILKQRQRSGGVCPECERRDGWQGEMCRMELPNNQILVYCDRPTCPLYNKLFKEPYITVDLVPVQHTLDEMNALIKEYKEAQRKKQDALLALNSPSPYSKLSIPLK